ncbi:MAG TPA: cytochrome c [Terriglobia bacterium]|nr:cytochrome c [Terriglobia bacterium]
MPRTVSLSILSGCCALSLALFSLTIYAQQSQTVRQGVYTEEQAKRGQAIYQNQCALCHGEMLEGRLGPPLAGDSFIADWDKQPLSELAGKIRNTMPQNAPGKLTPQQTADIVAYVLQVGKFPTGRTELAADEAALQKITWPAGNTAPPKPATNAAQAPSFPPAGNMAQVMRGILFPSSNILFTVQSVDPGAPTTPAEGTVSAGGFNWVIWGGGIYKGWELVDYAAVALAESAPLMLTPGRRCENGKPVPVNDPEWVKFTIELAEAGKAAYKAAQSRNQEAVSDITNLVADSCLNCHQVYRDRRGRVLDPTDPSNKAARCVK